MPSKEISSMAQTGPSSQNVTGYVPIAVAAEVSSDAKREDRSESYIVCKILTEHYAPRFAKRARQLKRAA